MENLSTQYGDQVAWKIQFSERANNIAGMLGVDNAESIPAKAQPIMKENEDLNKRLNEMSEEKIGLEKI